MPMRRRTFTESIPGSSKLRPSKRIVPCMRALGIRSFIRLKQRSNVLLPQPEGPISAVTLRFGMSNEIASSAWKLP